MIHPPVQGGNGMTLPFTFKIGDTPSRTGRKHLGCSAGILGYSIAEMKAFEENLSYKNQPFSYKNDILDI